RRAQRAHRAQKGRRVSAIALELGVFGLMVAVFVAGLAGPRGDARRAGVITALGLAGLIAASWRVDVGGVLFGGAYVHDELALFAKRVFLVATLVAVVASLANRGATFARRAMEYHL